MNLHYLATFLFLASSASEAKNLRFEKPERLLGGLKESQTHHQTNSRVETSVETQVRILKASEDWVDTFNAICVLPRGCDNVDEDDLERMAKDALKDFNSESYDSCSQDECPNNPNDPCWKCYRKSGDNERFGTVLDSSCNRKEVERDLEDEMDSALSGSNKSKKSKRVRMLRRLKSGLSSSPDDANFNMACFRESQVNTRGCDGEDVDLKKVADRLAEELATGTSFDLGGRRLKSGRTNVVIADLDTMANERCVTRSDPIDNTEIGEEEFIQELINALQIEWDN